MSENPANFLIKCAPSDNVGIVTHPFGLTKGTTIINEIILQHDIPMGHKVALEDLLAGDSILRYGHKIGIANTDISKGSWVNEENIDRPNPPSLKDLQWKPSSPKPLNPIKGYTFQGFKNNNGSVGTKNILGISTSVQCVAGMTKYIEAKIRRELLPHYPNVDDVVAFNHSYGCGVAINTPAAMIPIRTIKHIAQNPNFGNEIMIIGLGCEKLRPERLLPENAKDNGSSVVYLQDESFKGFGAMVAGIMDTAERHLKKLNTRERVTCEASDLVVGLQCGGSDAFSGLTGNPVAGYAADLIVRAGGTVLFSEVTEVRDGIDLLLPRAATQQVANALIEEMRWYDDYLTRGQADHSANTTPGNKRGGLSNIVEKALGSIVKSGTTSIMDVVSPGEKIRTKGLNFVATPAGDFVCGTLQLAAGMNMHVFITGRGTPYGLNVVPVIKISSNSKLSDRWFDLIDLDAGPVALGTKNVEELGWDLFHLILDVASGKKKVATDLLGLYNDLVLFNPGPLT
ncbi:MAG: galactarate dehydratase [Saprospiraceae bacterium]|nr:galactarate dehydratase [Saprospiraceae bacterium]